MNEVLYTCTPTCVAHLTKFIQVYLNGPETQNHSTYQNEAMENVHHWPDGSVPYRTEPTNPTARQPVGDNFVSMDVPGYLYVDDYVLIYQVNRHNLLADQLLTLVLDVTQLPQNSHAGLQDSESVPHPSNCTHISGSPASPCASITSIAWGDSVPSPTPHSQHHLHSDDAISGTRLQLNNPPQPGSPSVSDSHLPNATDGVPRSQLR